MASKGHNHPSLAINIAIGQSVAQALKTPGNKTTQTGPPSLQTPRSVTVSPLITSTVLDQHTAQSMTLPAAINKALQVLAKTQPSNFVPLQPELQVSRPPGVSVLPISSIPPALKPASRPLTLNVKVTNPQSQQKERKSNVCALQFLHLPN